MFSASFLLAQQAAEGSNYVPRGLLDGIDGDLRFVILISAVGCLTGAVIATVAITSYAINRYHAQRDEAELKREMLERGMSSEEIARVIEATAAESTSGVSCWGKPKRRK